jgi:pimeloyl-ACP methyl ester carboxylesterase
LSTSPVSRAGRFTETDWQNVRDALAQPGALRAALNYYRAAGRAMLRLSSGAREPSRVDVPTLLLWGERDRALVPRLTRGLERWVARLTIRRFPEAGHWVHWDEPAAVTDAMLTEEVG